MSDRRDPSSARGPLVQAVLAQVRPLVLSSARVVDLMWRPEGVTVGMRAVLGILHDDGPTPVPAIAEQLDLARQGVQRHVNDLIGPGLADTRPNHRHRRSVLIAATGTGHDLCARIRQTELARLSDIAPGCGDDDLRTAARVLAALNHDVRERVTRLREEAP